MSAAAPPVGDIDLSSPTVNQTPGGAPLGTQEVPLGDPTPAGADSHLAPYVCGSQGPPG